MIKALEYKGKLFVSKEPMSVKQAWVIVKNTEKSDDLESNINKSCILLNKCLYNCSYPSEIESAINLLNDNLFINNSS